MWRPVNLTQETLTDWRERKADVPKARENASSEEKDRLVYIDGLGAIRWGPDRGRPLELDHMVVGLFEERKPFIAHLYFRPHTPPTRAVNVGADAEVGKVIADVLEARYQPHTYKIEYYHPKSSGLDLNAMCVIVTDTPFTKGKPYREETMQMIDAALGAMEV